MGCSHRCTAASLRAVGDSDPRRKQQPVSCAGNIQRDVATKRSCQDKYKNAGKANASASVWRPGSRSRTRELYEASFSKVDRAYAAEKRPGILIRRATVGTSRSLKYVADWGSATKAKAVSSMPGSDSSERRRWLFRYKRRTASAHHVVLPDGRWHRFVQLGASMPKRRKRSPVHARRTAIAVRETTQLGFGLPLLRNVGGPSLWW